MLQHFRHISSVALATMASRILGLIRDILLFAALGVGSLNSAFIFGFTLPNLFRRLLGEGALTSAAVPVLSAAMEDDGKGSAYALLNKVLSRLGVILTLLTIAGMLLLAGLHSMPGLPQRWYDGADFSILLLPYMILICLAAMVTACLNTMSRFFWPAMSAVWLNLTMIAALTIPLLGLIEEPRNRVWLLCGGVLAGGILQLLVPAKVLWNEGWRPKLDFSGSEQLRELQRLLIPGLAAAAVFQINILVSRTLAFSLNDEAAGILYLANRLIELPLGVFAIAVTTVLFPALARLAASKEMDKFTRDYDQGVLLVMAITVPAGFGLMGLGSSILTALFQWGLFDSADVRQTTLPLAIYAFAVPFYAWATLITRGFHALKDMRTPVRLAVINLVLNAGLSLLLMHRYEAAGLAAANLIATVVHCVLMHRSLPLGAYRHGSRVQRWVPLIKIGAAGTLMLVVISLGQNWFYTLLSEPKLAAICSLLVLIPAGMTVYAGVLLVIEPKLGRTVWTLLKQRRLQ